MKECKFIDCNDEKCKENAFEDSDYCILHMELPENEFDPEFRRISKLKDEKVQQKICNGNFNFKEAKLFNVNILDSQTDFLSTLDFEDADIKGNVNFIGQKKYFQSINFSFATIEGNINFENLEASEIEFSSAKKINRVIFENIKVSGDIRFNDAELRDTIIFKGVSSNNLSFFKIKARYVLLNDLEVSEDLNFESAELEGSINIEGKVNIGDNVWFREIKSVRSISFDGNEKIGKIKVAKDISLGFSKINRELKFNSIEMGGELDLMGIEVGYDVLFNDTNVKGDIIFTKAEINSDLIFNNVEIEGNAKFHTAKIVGKLDCSTVKFHRLNAREETFRVAKNTWEALGNREMADNCFYHEMEAKRKQKGKWVSKLEYIFIQESFGYGIYPWRVIGLWFLFIFVFGLIYLILGYLGIYFGFKVIDGIDGSLWQVPDYFYFSIFTATGFDFVQYSLKSEFQILASIEVVFGIFIWAAFLVIFARKYMR